MDEITLWIIAVGLAVDAFAVSITSGVAIHRMKLRHAMTIAGFFGSFQALMPFVGWSLGIGLADYIKSFDHWIAFALLSIVGGKMLYEAHFAEQDDAEKANPLNLYILVTLAIATSIDALAVGLTFSFLGVDIVHPIIVIGLVTFAMSLAGVYIGDAFGHLFETHLETIAGLVLIAIGTKILIEHLQLLPWAS